MRALLAVACVPFLLLAQDEPAPIRVDVSLVTVACMVRDHDGAFVAGLKMKDFRLSDNGKPREIKYLWQEDDLPLTVGLVVDVSGSQARVIQQHREAVTQFLKQVLGPKDQAFIVTVGVDVKLVTDLTGSIPELQKGVRDLDSRQLAGRQLGEPCFVLTNSRGRRTRCGGTALWNGVYAAAKLKMKDVAGRKALIVITDGLDTGSFHKLNDAIEAAQSSDTLVYTIYTPSFALAPRLLFTPLKGERLLARLAEETGAKVFPDPAVMPAEIFAEIERELRSEYVLGFAPPEGAKSEGRHKLDVKVSERGVTVRARKEYQVP